MEINNEPVVQMRDVTKRFGDINAVDTVSLDVPQGSIFGFIGPSGCGKTTTVRLLIGNYGATDGTIKVLGKTPAHFKRDDQKRIGYMPQLFILYPELTIWENLNFAASIYGYTMNRRERLEELLDLVELTGHEKKMVRNISGGMQRRLSLASTLIHSPELIFLDEPTAGIDPVLRRKFWDHFQTLKGQGHTLFVTTQYVGEAAYCDYVGVMRNGKLLMVETPEMLRYRALNGHVVDLRTVELMDAEAVGALQDHPLVKEEVKFLDPLTARLTVENASTAIPQLLDWCETQGLSVESVNEFVPPFDDIFVMIMEQVREKEEMAL
jgi:ABC-2 type transport system ATP-binding protein